MKVLIEAVSLVFLMLTGVTGTSSRSPVGVQPAAAVEQCFSLDDQHIRLFRNSAVIWDQLTESGTAVVEIVPEHRRRNIPIALSLRLALLKGLTHSESGRADLEKIFGILVSSADLPPGDYELDPGDVKITTKEGLAQASLEKRRFGFRAEHLKLLRHVSIGWISSYNSIAVDPKRPYGSMTSFEVDMAGILGSAVAEKPGGAKTIGAEDRNRLSALHDQLADSLRVLMKYGTLAPGDYCRSSVRGGRWVFRG